jgi:DUF2075 family protein
LPLVKYCGIAYNKLQAIKKESNMQAFIHAIRDNGMDILGTEKAMVTNEYKSFESMMRYAITPFIKRHGNCHVEAFYDFGNRYGTPDIDVYYVNGYKIKFNKHWNNFQVNNNLADFDTLQEAVSYCLAGKM